MAEPLTPEKEKAARDKLAADPEAYLRGGEDHDDILTVLYAVREEEALQRDVCQGLIEQGWDIMGMTDIEIEASPPGSSVVEKVKIEEVLVE